MSLTPERWELVRTAIGRARQSSYYARSLATMRLEEPADFTRLPLTKKQDIANAGAFDRSAKRGASAQA